MTAGKCPSCNEIVGQVVAERVLVIERNRDAASDKHVGVSYLCRGCGTVLGVGIHPLAIRDDIIAKIKRILPGRKKVRRLGRHYARLGEFYLEEAVLDVLLEARYEGQCLGYSEISRRAGLYRERGPHNLMHDAIVSGIMNKLADQGRVARCEQPNGRGGWKVTDAEFAARKDDIPA